MNTFEFIQVHVKRSVLGKDADYSSDNESSAHLSSSFNPPMLRKGKLVVVDLAGSERIHKSGTYHNMNIHFCKIVQLFIKTFSLHWLPLHFPISIHVHFVEMGTLKRGRCHFC